LLALEPARHLPRQQREEGAVELHHVALRVDDEPRVDERLRGGLELRDEALERGVHERDGTTRHAPDAALERPAAAAFADEECLRDGRSHVDPIVMVTCELAWHCRCSSWPRWPAPRRAPTSCWSCRAPARCCRTRQATRNLPASGPSSRTASPSTSRAS